MTEFYGDHPALDLMNTVVQGEETWHGDADVLAWLESAGQVPAGAAAPGRPGELLAAARALRETVRTAVAARKAGKRVDAAALNAALAHAQRHMVLVEESGDGLSLQARYAAGTPQQLLAPLAEAAAHLLAWPTSIWCANAKITPARCGSWTAQNRTAAAGAAWRCAATATRSQPSASASRKASAAGSRRSCARAATNGARAGRSGRTALSSRHAAATVRPAPRWPARAPR